MVENCWGGSGYSAETQGRLGFKELNEEEVNALLVDFLKQGFSKFF